eukprot:CAMPEP_0113881378 /NCGR_PEP_ID=MMETSP0780_2-20120614/8341_1 /TAXON_ID=652834 /ORGANISM="Palpitomonas bilix" /LENGTH=88 /DNA_ID=CAMNT_0000868225 /DNA_START=79 /DNA_END=345 /DNA_ORIENTATION=- /assembly_acc=CAM_ASM_000599
MPLSELYQDTEAPEMKVSQKEMEDAKLDIGYRDFCAHLLIPLNKCRVQNFYLPWKCEEERHSYEKCQYDDYVRRVNKLTKERLEAKGF